MMKNHNYNLVHLLARVNSTLWRMDQYKKDAESCEHCLGLWDALQTDVEKHSKMLIGEIKNHVSGGGFE